ncbi:MAG: TonB-dependent receptor [Endomicrobia bacterium]|nr:TonB-dependent receptor [Endomicrobiia bacterium]
MRKIFAVFVSFFILNSISFAQDAYLSLEKIGAGGTGDFSSRTIVSKEEIENQNTPVMLDLISSIPGVFVAKGATAVRADVNIRGLGDSFRNIGLFIDGRPEKVAVYGCAVSQTVLAGNIKSIEVIKTPDSVIYGSDGFGGVVNVKTHDPSRPLETELSFSYGSYNSQSYYANVSEAIDNILYQISLNRVSSDGHLENSGYDMNDFYGKFGYIIDDTSKIIVNGKYFSGKDNTPQAAGFDNLGQIITLAPSSYEYKRSGIGAKYDKIFSESTVEILTFGDFGEHSFSNGFHSKDAMFGIFAHFENMSFSNNLFKYGAEYRYSYADLISGNPKIGQWSKNEIAVYGLDEYSLNAKTVFTAGARYNYDEASGGVFGAKTGVSYAVTGRLLARAVYGRNFRTPYINELYSLPVSNKDLKPQIQDSYEIGAASKYFDINFDVYGFISKGANMIQVIGGKFQNSGSYEFKGFEASADKEIIKDLKIFTGYSYLDPGNLTQGLAQNKIDLSFNYKTGKLNFYVSGMFAFDYYAANNFNNKLKDFNIFNAKINYNFTDEFSMFAAADNFTDQKYDMFIVNFGQAAIYEMPGASYTLGAKYKF